jgi:hypothetical protein
VAAATKGEPRLFPLEAEIAPRTVVVQRTTVVGSGSRTRDAHCPERNPSSLARRGTKFGVRESLPPQIDRPAYGVHLSARLNEN